MSHMPENTLQHLERRLEALERGNRRLKRLLVLLLLPVIAVGVIGWTAGPKDKTLSAHSLTIVGKDGQKRIVLQGEDPGGWIWLYDKNGKCIFRVGATSDTMVPYFELKKDENHQVNFNFAGQKSHPALLIGNPAGLRAVLGVNDRDIAEMMLLNHKPSELNMDAVHFGVHETGVTFLKAVSKGKTVWTALP